MLFTGWPTGLVFFNFLVLGLKSSLIFVIYRKYYENTDNNYKEIPKKYCYIIIRI